MNIKKWKCPEARFMMNFAGHNAIVNALAANRDGVLVSGADNGSHKRKVLPTPGSLSASIPPPLRRMMLAAASRCSVSSAHPWQPDSRKSAVWRCSQ